MANPNSNFFASEAKRGGTRDNSKYRAKRNKHRKANKKKNKRGKRQYSSDEEAPDYDRHHYRPAGFEDDDINQRANIADYSNYRDSKSDLEYDSESSGSGSDSDSSSGSEGSSASKKRDKERKTKDKKAKDSLKKANRAK